MMRGWIGKRRRSWESGQVSLEYIGWLPLLLFVALACAQLGIAAYAASQAGTGARAAARAATMDQGSMDPQVSGKRAMSDWMASKADITADYADEEMTAEARVKIPSVVPGIGDFGHVSKTVTMSLR